MYVQSDNSGEYGKSSESDNYGELVIFIPGSRFAKKLFKICIFNQSQGYHISYLYHIVTFGIHQWIK